MARIAKDITGEKYNRLTAEEYLGGGVWRWRCDCGQTREVTAYLVKSGRIKECKVCSGKAHYNVHTPAETPIGRRFGKLVVEKYLGNKRWLCRCDCGGTREANTQQINEAVVMPTACVKCEQVAIKLRAKFRKANVPLLEALKPRTEYYALDDTHVYVFASPSSRRAFIKRHPDVTAIMLSDHDDVRELVNTSPYEEVEFLTSLYRVYPR